MKHMWSEEEVNKAPKVLDSLVDSKGNPRFIEGDLTTTAIEGVTFSYAKWSLSGSHLMLVLAGSVANGTAIPAVDWAKIYLPTWILNKIYTVWGDRIERKGIELIATNYSAQSLTVYLGKQSSYLFITAPTITLTAERFFRIQFDLLIDTE